VSRKARILVVVVTLSVLAAARAAVAADQAPTPAASQSSATKSQSLDEITIRGHRAELERRASRFVNRIAATENAEGLPRWNWPVCPLVTGLPRSEGEFILERLSEVARAAEVPLADEHCRPNLYVVVTPDPRKALEGLDSRHRETLFRGTGASVVHDFIVTPRAVRVWYNTAMTSPDGVPPGILPGCTIGPLCNVPIFDHVDDTRLSLNRIWNLSRVVLIVDEARLKAVSRGQLADYAAMVGLAEIKPDARLGDAETILKLFDAAAAAAPAGMTDWDRAFLKGLYATKQKSKGQRSEIASTIVREIGG